MQNLVDQIFNLLITSPGNLIYHIILPFITVMSLQIILLRKSKAQNGVVRRTMTALAVILVGQILLFLSSGLAWQGIANPHNFLPPLDRAIFLLSILWLIWIWVFPQPAKVVDAIFVGLNLAVIIFFLYTFTSWNNVAVGNSFNANWLDMFWLGSGIVLIMIGVISLIIRRPETWAIGLGFFAIHLAGLVYQLFFPDMNVDYSAPIRLAQICAYPLLTYLAIRSLDAPVEHEKTAPISAATPVKTDPRRGNQRTERRRYSAETRTIHYWLELFQNKEPEHVSINILKAVAQTVYADMTYLVTVPTGSHEMILQTGWDLIREQELPGTYIPQAKMPMTFRALSQKKSLIISSAPESPQDLTTISQILGLKEPGFMMVIPLQVPNDPTNAIILLSPYSKREWNQDDITFLNGISAQISGLLSPLSANLSELENEKLRSEIIVLKNELNNTFRDRQNLLEEIDALKVGSTPVIDSRDQQLEALLAVQREALETIKRLEIENTQLQEAIDAQSVQPEPKFASAHGEQIEADLRLTLQEIARLKSELEEAEIRNEELQKQSAAPDQHIDIKDQEVFSSMVQELRQPMSSILGYTDILLSESVGILGALQRKFLDRIKASTERMRSLLEDLVQVVTYQDGELTSPQPVDLNELIDQAVSDTRAQLREKNITLLVDLEEDNPRLFADKDALQQVVINLLQNAGSATPAEGTITLRMRMDKNDERNFLLMQVTDTGGGIPKEDLPKVFAKRFRAEQALIQGLGDTGIGLSIAKTLVEAHGGRIWVDSDPGKSSTFSVLLPVQPENA